MDINEWLHQLNLDIYCQSFQDHDIDADVLPFLTADDLSDLGVTKVGHRVKLLKAIATLSENAESPGHHANNTTGYLSNTPHAITSSQAERRHLTVMFIDIVGSTELTTRLDPEDIRAVYAGFQSMVESVIRQYDGFIASYMGDGVMCYFGWPKAHEDDAERAVRAGLSVIDNAIKSKKPDGSPLAVRVGMASGLAVVGDIIGSGASEEASIAGQTPNLAARMQSVADPNQLVLPNTTRQLLNENFKLKSTGLHRLKGFAEPIEAYVVTGENDRDRRFQEHRATSMSALVGRDTHLSEVRGAWTTAQQGDGQVVIIHGEPGIGKSRLVQAVIDEDDTSNTQFLRITLQCSHYYSENALYPLIRHLKADARHLATDTDRQRLDKLKKLSGISGSMIPILATLLDIDSSAGFESPDLTPSQLRVKTLEILVQLLQQLAQAKPLMIVFEDLHWIDPTSLDFVNLLIQSMQNDAIFLLATTRPTFKHQFENHKHLHNVHLTRLPHEQVITLVSDLINQKSIPEEVLNIILDRTDGIPLFVEELTKTILESEVLELNNDSYRLNGPLNRLAIPSTLHDSLLARLDRLEPVKRVAQTASCIGRDFSHSLLTHLLPLTSNQLDQAINTLIEAELVFQTGHPSDRNYQFKHALVRDAAYESLLKSNRRAIHSNVLQILETDTNTSADLLATHAEAAGLTDKAIKLWESACQAAVKRPAFDEAIAHVNHALKLNRPALDAGDPVALEIALSLQVQLGMIAAPRFGWGAHETKEAFEYASTLSKKSQNSAFRFTIAYGLINSQVTRAEYHRAIADGSRFIEIAEESMNTAAIIVAHRSVAMAMLPVGILEGCQQHCEKALSLFNPQEHSGLYDKYGIDLGIACYTLTAGNLLNLGRSRECYELLEKCKAFAKNCNDVNSISFMYASICSIAITSGDDAELEATSRLLTQLTTEHKLSGFKNWSVMFRGMLMISAGDADGVGLFEEGHQMQIKSSNFYRLGTGRISSGHRLYDTGNFALARQFAKTVEEHVNRTGEYQTLLSLNSLKAKLALTDGNENAAKAYLTLGLKLSEEQCNRLWQIRLAIQYAELTQVQNRLEEGITILQRAYDNIAPGNCISERSHAETLLHRIRTDLC